MSGLAGSISAEAWLRSGAGNLPTASAFSTPPCESRLGRGEVGDLGSYKDDLDLKGKMCRGKEDTDGGR